ncbi:MAG: M23 family metallopeptidase [Desulfobacterales bacterium]|nr:M23 family metallopeptidase [Desulfobacterales bacterium]
MKKLVYFVVCIGILLPLGWGLLYKYEGEKPLVDISMPSIYLNKKSKLSLNITDSKTGLRHVAVYITQQNNEKKLLEKSYPASSIQSFFSDKKVTRDDFEISIESRKYGMVDGDAVIRVQVSDYSWRDWNKGNVYELTQKVIIDSKPPRVKVLTSRHNIQKGGAGLVIYRVFEEDVKSGVMVGDNFFPGASGMFNDPNVYAAFFALNHTQGQGTRIWVRAEDVAGNMTKRGFRYYIGNKNFKTDTLTISDRFLEIKMPNFDLGDLEEQFSATKNPNLSKFLEINRNIRQANVDRILSVPSDTASEVLWQGRFGRLPGSANRAGFADRRIYKYKGKEVDRATHLGIDLASTANAEVLAGNTGRIIMAESVGIFGNSIIIDHGFGLASLYSHLDSMNVGVGDTVKKGDLIGYTGITGLVGGDHLHFSMIVHNTFVNPVEWWDRKWIKNNITQKIEAVRKMITK